MTDASSSAPAPARGSAASALAMEGRLRQALDSLDRPLVREWSVKSAGGALLPGRWLASAPRSALGPGPGARLREMLRGLAAPAEGIASLDVFQAQSIWVHFGHEPDPAGTVLKCYLEFPPAARPQPDLAYLALKWREDGRWTLSSYVDRKALHLDERKALLRDVLPSGPAREAMEAFMDMGSPASQSFLKVTEPQSPRRSLDLNLTALRAKVRDQEDRLLTFLGGGDATLAYLRALADQSLGHIAAGLGRDGRVFATLYHGAHRVHGPL